MFTPPQETTVPTTGRKPSPFVSARVYLSRDGRNLLHVLPDGGIVCRPVDYYRDLLARSRGESALAAVHRFFASPMAKVAQSIVLWLLRLILLAWLALHPGMPFVLSHAILDRKSYVRLTESSILT